MMRIVYTLLILFVFSASFSATARAEGADTPVSTPEKAATPPADMGDRALASYISGRLTAALSGGEHRVSQVCDDNGCSVVVQ